MTKFKVGDKIVFIGRQKDSAWGNDYHYIKNTIYSMYEVTTNGTNLRTMENMLWMDVNAFRKATGCKYSCCNEDNKLCDFYESVTLEE